MDFVDQFELANRPEGDAREGKPSECDGRRTLWVLLGVRPRVLGLVLEAVEEALCEGELRRPNPKAEENWRDGQRAGQDGEFALRDSIIRGAHRDAGEPGTEHADPVCLTESRLAADPIAPTGGRHSDRLAKAVVGGCGLVGACSRVS